MMQFENLAGIDWATKVRQVAVAIKKPHGPEVDAMPATECCIENNRWLTSLTGALAASPPRDP